MLVFFYLWCNIHVLRIFSCVHTYLTLITLFMLKGKAFICQFSPIIQMNCLCFVRVVSPRSSWLDFEGDAWCHVTKMPLGFYYNLTSCNELYPRDRDFLNPSTCPIWVGRILEWAGICWTSFISELHLTAPN